MCCIHLLLHLIRSSTEMASPDPEPPLPFTSPCHPSERDPSKSPAREDLGQSDDRRTANGRSVRALYPDATHGTAIGGVNGVYGHRVSQYSPISSTSAWGIPWVYHHGSIYPPREGDVFDTVVVGGRPNRPFKGSCGSPQISTTIPRAWI